MNEKPEQLWVLLHFRDGSSRDVPAPKRGTNEDGLTEYAVAVDGDAPEVVRVGVDVLPARSTLVLEAAARRREGRGMKERAELDWQRQAVAWVMDREVEDCCVHCGMDVDFVSESYDPADGSWWVHVDTGKRECEQERLAGRDTT